MTKLFGSSGIRGKYGEKITPEFVLNVGKALGTYLKQGKVLLARDTRLTSKTLENIFAAGVESTGIKIIRTGVVPTPALAFATKKLGMQAGIIITASHNPPEYNGIKFWNADTSAYTPEMEKEIEKKVDSKSQLADWREIAGSEKVDILDDYTKTILKAAEIKQKHKIALDCGHGAACVVSPELLSQVGTVSKIFSEPDGTFTGRKSEPAEENLEELKKKVIETGSEVGFAHDGDGDRLGVIDEKGNFVKKDKLLALLALNEIEKGGNIVFPVDTSLLVEETILNAGGTVSMTPIGDVHVAVEMKKTNAVFGGEPSGCFIFPKVHWCPDGILASLKVLEIIEKKNKPLSEIIAELPDYFTKRTKIECEEDEKEKKCNELYEKIRSLKGAERILEIDGVRADFKDAWVMARPSGTEPILRITVEARTKERAEELFKLLSA